MSRADGDGDEIVVDDDDDGVEGVRDTIRRFLRN